MRGGTMTEPEPERWHLSPVEITVCEDGTEQWSWCQIESPDLASEWREYAHYYPDRVWLN